MMKLILTAQIDSYCQVWYDEIDTYRQAVLPEMVHGLHELPYPLFVPLQVVQATEQSNPNDNSKEYKKLSHIYFHSYINSLYNNIIKC